MKVALGLLLLSATSFSTGCAVARVSAPLPSDPIVDWHAMSLSGPVARRSVATDEEVARAVHLLLEGKLADLSGECRRGQEALEEAARLAPAHPVDEARREHARRCDVDPRLPPAAATLASR